MTVLMKKILTIVALSTALLLAACGDKSPQPIAQQYVKAIYSGDANTMFNLLASDKKAQPEVKQKFDTAIAKMIKLAQTQASNNQGVASISYTEPTFSKDKKTAVIKVIVLFANDKFRQENLKLKDTAQGWRVQ